MSPYTIVVYDSCRGAKLAGLVVGFVRRCYHIELRAASKAFTSTRKYGRLSLKKGLVVPAKKATEEIRSLRTMTTTAVIINNTEAPSLATNSEFDEYAQPPAVQNEIQP